MIRVTWQTRRASARGETLRTEHKHFDERLLAQHFVAHVVMAQGPERVCVKEVQR